jgi:hypothetical protein
MEQEIEMEEGNQVKEEENEQIYGYEQDKGWGGLVGSIDRKVAIVGTTAVAAPVVILPAIVLSTVGGALCVPFGLYLGTLALTDKFMGFLLPHIEIEDEPRGEWRVRFHEASNEDHEVIH